MGKENDLSERTHLDLFSGIGGFALAGRNCGVKTVAFCEIEPYCQEVLQKNFGAVMADANGKQDDSTGAKSRGHREQGRDSMEIRKQATRQTAWRTSTNDAGRCSPVIYGDIRALDGRDFAGVWLLTGGFPCQPFSVSGKQRGKADDRWLWPEMLRIISESRPTWVLGENVANITRMALDDVLADLENHSYSCRAFNIPACAVEAAPHRRERIWIAAYLNGGRCDQRECGGEARHLSENKERNTAEIQSAGSQLKPEPWQADPDSNWNRYSALCRGMADGLPNRVDRLRGLGNAIVPQVAEQIIKAMIETESIL
jgi:DNA (cytosine-5)-methyltransferase 1